MTRKAKSAKRKKKLRMKKAKQRIKREADLRQKVVMAVREQVKSIHPTTHTNQCVAHACILAGAASRIFKRPFVPQAGDLRIISASEVTTGKGRKCRAMLPSVTGGGITSGEFHAWVAEAYEMKSGRGPLRNLIDPTTCYWKEMIDRQITVDDVDDEPFVFPVVPDFLWGHPEQYDSICSHDPVERCCNEIFKVWSMFGDDVAACMARMKRNRERRVNFVLSTR